MEKPLAKALMGIDPEYVWYVELGMQSPYDALRTDLDLAYAIWTIGRMIERVYEFHPSSVRK